ncbi:MAG: hypothetical protein Ct9H300mP1_10960 [Planctomycetaceae bacterium]|nr:MAG: hypothetical protein Ct9H300mP1_10960 [Planctomycetaceae bacterium]
MPKSIPTMSPGCSNVRNHRPPQGGNAHASQPRGDVEGFFTDMCPDQPTEALARRPLSHGSGLYALPNVAMAATT